MDKEIQNSGSSLKSSTTSPSTDPTGISSQSHQNPVGQQFSTESQAYGLGAPGIIPSLGVPQAHDDQFRFMDFEIDASAGGTSTGSERHPSCSDNPSPNTNKTSSSSSFSPAHIDQPSPKQGGMHSQKPLPQIPSSIPYVTNDSRSGFGASMQNPNKSNTIPFPQDFPATGSEAQLHQELFSLPEGWDFIQQQQQSRPNEPDLIPPTPTSSTMEAILSTLEDIPWSQSPETFNTNNQWAR